MIIAVILLGCLFFLFTIVVSMRLCDKRNTPVLYTLSEPFCSDKSLYQRNITGIQDTYDTEGNKLSGVEPNPEMAIESLKRVIQSKEGQMRDVLELAKLYHRGMHELEPDFDIAERLYLLAIHNQSTKDEAERGLRALQQAKAYEWLNLQRVTTREADTRPIEVVDYGIDDFLTEVDNYDHLFVTPVFEERVGVLKEYNDPQNTHDPQVLSTVRKSVRELKANEPSFKEGGDAVKEIRAIIEKLPNNDKKNDSRKSLQSIVDNGLKAVSGVDGDNEQDMLSLVWNRIKTYNIERRQDATDILIEQLASMQEHGSTVCATGKITRIIDTLNGIDDAVSIKPAHAVHEEMMGKSAHIRNVFAKALPNKDEYEAGTANNQGALDTKLRDTIKDTLKKEYVDTNILSPSEFNSEVDKWIDFV